MLFSISPVLAPIFGGFLHDYFGWRSVFWFLVIYGLAVFIYAILIVKETLIVSNRNSIRFLEVMKVYKRSWALLNTS